MLPASEAAQKAVRSAMTYSGLLPAEPVLA